MQNLLAHWWFRISLIIVASVVYFIAAVYIDGRLLSVTIFLVVITALSLFIEQKRAGSNWKTFGLQFDRFTLPDLAKGLYLSIAVIILFILVGYLFGYSIEYNAAFFDIELTKLIFFILFLFVMATNEELILRGVIFQSIRERFGDIAAILALSVVFSILHFANPNINVMAGINIFLAGILLSVMYITTESLWLPISFHFFWNLNQIVLLGSNVSGIEFDHKLFKANFFGTEHSWLFGSNFGIEEGIMTTIVLTILIFLSFKINKQNPYITSIKFKRKFEESKILNQ